MNALEMLRTSPAWSPGHELPLCPELNNPWMYGALSFKLLARNATPEADLALLRLNFLRYAAQCAVGPVGLFYRWPNGYGGSTSWDEILGMGYLSSLLAREILEHLMQSGGLYDTQHPYRDEIAPREFADEDRNLLRFPSLMAFLRARAGYRVNLFDQVMLATQFLKFSFDGAEAGTYLRRWLMVEEAEKLPVTGPFVRYWKSKVPPPQRFLAIEPREYPVFTTLAEGLSP
jgi:hypothetical protein